MFCGQHWSVLVRAASHEEIDRGRARLVQAWRLPPAARPHLSVGAVGAQQGVRRPFLQEEAGERPTGGSLGRRLEAGDLQHQRPLNTQPPAAQRRLHQAPPPWEADGLLRGHHEQLPGDREGKCGAPPHEGSPQAGQARGPIPHPPRLPLLPLQVPLYDGSLRPPGRHRSQQWRTWSLPWQSPWRTSGGRIHLTGPPLCRPDQVGHEGRHTGPSQGRGRVGVLLPPGPRELRQHVGQGEKNVPATGGGWGRRPDLRHSQVRPQVVKCQVLSWVSAV